MEKSLNALKQMKKIVSKVNKLLFYDLYLVDETENGLAKTGRILQKQRRKDITNYNKNDT